MLNVLIFVLKYFPLIESAAEILWKDYEGWKARADQKIAADKVSKAIASANTTEINQILGGKHEEELDRD